MIEVGNLRVKMKNSSIWATIGEDKTVGTQKLFDCPFTYEYQLTNALKNGYELSFTEGAKIDMHWTGSQGNNLSMASNDSYSGGVFGCPDLKFDLTKNWSVEFEYKYIGSMEKNSSGGTTSSLATDWNHIFAWGRHIALPNKEGDTIDWPFWGLTIAGARQDSESSEVSGYDKCIPWCADIGSAALEWHKYKIEFKDGATTVYVDNVSKLTRQCVYSEEVPGFYLSGGGYEHSLPCEVKNLVIYATIAIEK